MTRWIHLRHLDRETEILSIVLWIRWLPETGKATQTTCLEWTSEQPDGVPSVALLCLWWDTYW